MKKLDPLDDELVLTFDAGMIAYLGLKGDEGEEVDLTRLQTACLIRKRDIEADESGWPLSQTRSTEASA